MMFAQLLSNSFKSLIAIVMFLYALPVMADEAKNGKEEVLFCGENGTEFELHKATAQPAAGLDCPNKVIVKDELLQKTTPLHRVIEQTPSVVVLNRDNNDEEYTRFDFSSPYIRFQKQSLFSDERVITLFIPYNREALGGQNPHKVHVWYSKMILSNGGNYLVLDYRNNYHNERKICEYQKTFSDQQ